ncbi:MAG: hypothetical protein JRN23_00405 [Nitrososphaerota archaeon]|nr:hypothetical protein [Nitrososphaerota archaeon]MDG6966196.1 hypothetical protein [Nitrososphaerota archaeon]MDG6968355.1 hypothetical protein [Nitrososphaerota archaeon]MDG6977631.1 hypothetical protein [Nitrososphaerota archaeon]MDG7020372.1 hypothetical protein [Nitrososphaerota archaeon]
MRYQGRFVKPPSAGAEQDPFTFSPIAPRGKNDSRSMFAEVEFEFPQTA